MNDSLPIRIPSCAVALLARREWFADPRIVSRARLSRPNWFARLLSSHHVAGQAIGAITLGRTIYFRQLDQYDPHTAPGLALLAHELKHVEQFEREGLPGFYAKYLHAFLAHGYGEQVPHESEAYEFQRRVAAHLAQEFDDNPGQCLCQEMAHPHTPNEKFIKTAPPVFRFA